MPPQPDTTLSGTTVASIIVATWAPKGYRRTITRLRITGPVPSQFDVYVGMINDSCKIATTNRGDVNQADFSQPLPIPAGIITYFVWSAFTAAVASTVTIGYSRDD